MNKKAIVEAKYCKLKIEYLFADNQCEIEDWRPKGWDMKGAKKAPREIFVTLQNVVITYTMI